MAPTSVGRSGPEGHGLAKSSSAAGKSYGDFSPHIQWKPAPMINIPLEFERQPFAIPYPPADELVCGDNFTVLVVRDSPDWFATEEETNRLFCCGENSRGQCGRNMQQSQQCFAAASTPKCSRTESISCGSSHCLVMLKRVGAGSQKPELWSWGSNEKGQ